MDWETAGDFERRQKIEKFARGLQKIFGSRASDIARRQHGAATVGSKTAEAWSDILNQLLKTRAVDKPETDIRPSPGHGAH